MSVLTRINYGCFYLYFFPVVLTKRDEETINNDTAKVPITGCEGWGIGFAMITNDGVNDVSECNWQAS